MRNRTYSRIAVLVLALLGFLFIVASCDPQPPDEPTPTPGTAAIECTSPSQEQRTFATGPYFVGQQVILSGPEDGVTQVRNEFDDRLEPLRECTVTAEVEERETPEEDQSPMPEPAEGAPGAERLYQRSPLSNGDPYALHLYEIIDGTPVAELVQEINRSADETDVYADPNYVTGHLAKSACGAEGSPFSVEGSPFSVEGSPFSVEGSAPHGGLGVDADPDDFRNQQAFALIEATPFPEGEHTGEGVRVGVFDTSPFANAEEAGEYGASLEPPLELQQVEVELRRLEQHVPVSDTVKEHGLFVTGLIHALAPESDYSLYRVLDDRGCGDLFGLVEGLHLYMAEASAAGGSLEDVVMNMSMGVLQPRDAGDQGLPEAVAALEAAVLEAHERGALLVAAAGNDSVSPELRLAAELPAAYREVIGAAAVNGQVAPTCYSNQGDVAAPAGEAALDSENDPPRCEPMAYTCTAAADGPACWWGVISLATVSETGYAYWVGTSFAAPLVSGLAAAADQSMAQGDVYGAIMSNAVDIGDPDFAAGVINVSGTLP